jgi:hypothetical protein
MESFQPSAFPSAAADFLRLWTLISVFNGDIDAWLAALPPNHTRTWAADDREFLQRVKHATRTDPKFLYRVRQTLEAADHLVDTLGRQINH